MTTSKALAVTRNLHMRIVAAKHMLVELIPDARTRANSVISLTLENARVDADELNEFLEALLTEQCNQGGTA
jgi:hypothetical protein